MTTALLEQFVDAALEAVVRRLKAKPERAEVLASLLARETAEGASSWLLDRNGLAKALRTSTSTVDRLVKQGMPFVMLCEARRFDPEEVRAWLKARTQDRE